jgi:hypothetical protein
MPKFLEDDVEFVRILVSGIYHFFADGSKQLYAAIGITLIVAFLYFKAFFRDVSGFQDDVDKAGKTPILDKDYDYVETQWSSDKILVWAAVSVGSGALAYYQLPKWFPHVLGN